MVNRFYVHRISKLIDELVLGAGLTVSISDDGLDPPFQHSQIEAAKNLCESMGVRMSHDTANGVNVLTFRKA